MKHSRSGSFESNGYAEPQKQTLLGDPLIWPSPSSWTVPSRAYEYRTVSFNFSDPRVPQILQHPIQVCCHSWTAQTGHLRTHGRNLIVACVMLWYGMPFQRRESSLWIRMGASEQSLRASLSVQEPVLISIC